VGKKEINSMKKLMTISMAMSILLMAGFLMNTGTPVRAEENDQGNVITWTTGSKHYIDGKYEVAEGDTLVIEPGVTVYFSYGGPSGGNPHSLRIKGKLLAVGEPDNPILFTSNESQPTPNDWDKIKFHSSADEASIMEHCIVEYSIQGIQTDRADVTIRNNVIRNIGKYGIKVVSSSPVIDNNTISTKNIGIRIGDEHGKATPIPTITGNTLENNDFYGILVDSASEAVIRNNVFRNSGEYGVYATVSEPQIEGNLFENNKIGLASVNSGGSIENNVISDSSDYGMLLKYANNADVKNNEITDNRVGMIVYNTEGELSGNVFTGSESLSMELYDSRVILADNEYERVISSTRHITLQVTNSDDYPVRGTAVAVYDADGSEITTQVLGEKSTVSLSLREYEMDALGMENRSYPYRIVVSKGDITTENSLDDLSEALYIVELEQSFVPGIVITTPDSIELEDGQATIKGTIDMDDLDTEEMDYSVMVRLNDGEWKEAVGKTRWGCVFSEKDVSKGDNKVEVKLLDGIGDPSVTKTIDIERESDTTYIGYIAAAVAIVIILILLSLVFMKRGKEVEEKEE